MISVMQKLMLEQERIYHGRFCQNERDEMFDAAYDLFFNHTSPKPDSKLNAKTPEELQRKYPELYQQFMQFDIHHSEKLKKYRENKEKSNE